VRERIQINNEPLSEAAFAQYFFSIWDRLEASAHAKGEPTDPCAKPVYFRYLTLMALHAYMSESADTVVVECGIGGEYDSTNILERPTVVGITNLGIDHTAMLGETIAEIAWHKAGIMKPGAVAYTVEQPEAAMAVLRERAVEKGVDLKIVRRHPGLEDIHLGLAADFQKINASMAIEIAAEHLRVIGYGHVHTNPLPDEFVQGLKDVRLGGRCETRIEGVMGWHLDGGHTLESINVAAEWFAKCVLESSIPASERLPPRLLIFNQQTRAGLPLLRSLHNVLSKQLDSDHPFSHVIFCSNVTFASGYRPDLVSMNVEAKDVNELKVQKELAKGWQGIDGAKSQVHIVNTIEEAVRLARELAGAWISKEGDVKKPGIEGQIKVLVTGSLHLVGGALEVLDTSGEASPFSS
jgi:folylpolyglutamate synthase